MPGPDISIIYLIKALIFGFAAFIIIPKEQYKKHFIYGLFLGAGIDIIMIVSLTSLGVIRYLHMGAFSIFGMFAFWTPIAWMFTLMVFLYLLPEHRYFYHGYIFIFAVYGVFVGQVLSNFGLFQLNHYILFAVFLAWFYFAAWVYRRMERIELVV